MALEQLYQAIIAGASNKVKELLSHGVNIYAANRQCPQMLWLALSFGKARIVNQILDFYEQDLKSLDNFFLGQNVTNYFWRSEIILIAYGIEHIKYASDKLREMIVIDPVKMVEASKKGLVILLKTSNSSEADVLWVTPQGRGDDIKIVETIDYISSDGCIVQNDDLLWQWHCETALSLTSRSVPEIFLRLVDVLYSHRDVSNLEYLEHIFYLANFTENKVNTFLSLSEKLGKFSVRDIFLANTDYLLERLAVAGFFDIFDYLINIAAEVKMGESGLGRNEILRSIVCAKNELGRNYVETAMQAGRNEFGINCLRYRPNLFASNEFKKTTFHAIMPVDREIVGVIIFENIDIILEKGFEKDIVTELFIKNWIEIVVKLYEQFPHFKTQLFKDREQGVQCFGMSIYACNDVTQPYWLYLLNAHVDDLTTDVVAQLIPFTRLNPKLLPILLTLPAATPGKLYKNAMFQKCFGITVLSQDVQNYTVLLEHFKDNAEFLRG